jgi:hypothetical protein
MIKHDYMVAKAEELHSLKLLTPGCGPKNRIRSSYALGDRV